MTNEEIRKAALAAYKSADGQNPLAWLEEVFRAGMEAGRAEAAANPKRRKVAEPHGGSYRPGFTRFWAAWPPSTRKGGKAECLRLWEAQNLEERVREVITHVSYMTTTQDWTKDGGAYIPAPAVYLRQKRWDGAEMPAPVATQKQPVESFASQAALARVQRIAPGAARKDAEPQKNWLQKWNEVIDDAGQPRLR